MAERWWAIRWHVLRLVVGNPIWFFAALREGSDAFRREFGRTWSNRWRAGDRRESWNRFGPEQPPKGKGGEGR